MHKNKALARAEAFLFTCVGRFGFPLQNSGLHFTSCSGVS